MTAAAEYPDVLQAAGIAPVEVGWAQLHLVGLHVSEAGPSTLEVWLQSAHEPQGAMDLELVDGATGEPFLRMSPPTLPAGAAAKWVLPVRMPPGVKELRCRVVAACAKGSVRVRPSWLQLERLALLRDRPDQGLATAATAVRFLRLGFAGWLAGDILQAASEAHLDEPPLRRILSGEPVATELEVKVRTGGLVAPSSPLELLWQPGEPLDPAKLLARAAATADVVCGCGSPIPAGAEFCPNCLAAVDPEKARRAAEADVERVESAPVMIAAASAASTAGAPHCAAHADRVSSATCERCGRFLCGDCKKLDEFKKVRCADCFERFSSPEALRQNARGELSRLLLVGGGIALAMGLFGVFTTVATEQRSSVLILVATTCVPTLLAGLAVRVLPAVVAGWLGVALPIVSMVGALVLKVSLVPIALGFTTFICWQRAARLRA